MQHPWHILGAGSIGGLFSVRLEDAGLAPVLLLRDDATQARWQAAAGLHLQRPDGSSRHLRPVVRTVAGAGAPRCLLVTTKAPDTLAALAPLVAGSGAGQLVLLLQNGMGVADRLRARWPALRLWCAVTTAGAWRESTFRLHCVAEGETHAGLHDAPGDVALDAAVRELAAAGILHLVDDVRPRLWHKLAVNAVINALTALHGCRNGELLELDATRVQLPLLAAEVEAIAAAEGIHLGAPVLALAEAVIRQTAGNYSSMNRDVVAGRRTEIDYINGYLVDRAGAHGLAAPAHAALQAAVRRLHPA